MKINNLKINGYGNIKNKDIELKNKINIIYGKNESGKSSLFKFIVNMLYGTSKNKKGQEYSDLEKYTPWETEEFSGRMSYELDNKNKYEIFREFKKKNPKIYNENSEDISKQYNNDKSKGIDFFYEQTGIDEELFLSSTAIMQEQVKLEKNNENSLIQKISNITSTGNDNISYKTIINKLNKKQLEEIGTEKSINRPLNKIENELNILNNRKNDLEDYKNNKYNIDLEKENLNKKIKELKNKIEILKLIKNKNDENKIEKEKIKLNEEIIEKNNLEIDEIENNINEQEKKIENIKKEKSNIGNKKIYICVFLILTIFSLFLKFVLNKNIFLILFGIFLVIFFISLLLYLKSRKIDNKNKKEIEKVNIEIKELKNKIDYIEKNNFEEEDKIEKIKNDLKLKRELEKEKIINENYQLKNEINKIYLENNIENILENNKNELSNNELLLHKLKIDEEGMINKLDELIQIDEKINSLNKDLDELKKKNMSIEIARESIEKAYKKMKENITPKFTKNLSEIIEKISNEKYKKIKLNSEDGLILEKENGEYIKANKLSVGTIDQIYLAFRLSILKEITDENIPIILDESFAYYDESRLENILKYLYKLDNQVIIFSCTNREKNILNKLNIEYNFIEL